MPSAVKFQPARCQGVGNQPDEGGGDQDKECRHEGHRRAKTDRAQPCATIIRVSTGGAG